MAKGGLLKSLKRIFSSIKLKKCGSKSRKTKRSKKSKKSQRGGGYSEKLDLSIYPGQQVHQAYGGPGYDCAGSPARPGALDSIGMLRVPGGLPGLSPGLFSGGGSQLGSGGIVVTNKGFSINGGKRKRRQQQGGTVPGIAGVSVGQGAYAGTPSSNTPAPATLQESQVAANINAARAQTGGRYGMEITPAALILDQQNAVGMSGYAQNGRIACETGTGDALNKNPGDIQGMSTLPSFAGVGNFTQRMGGGRRKNNGGFAKTTRRRTPRKQQKQKQKQQGGSKKKRLRRQQGGVVVGEVDAMRYYAPTAGYGNLPLMPQVPNNPGILMQLGYPAGHFNPACMKTN